MTKVEDEEKGLIFNIQRYSLHDGPGIRSTVFLKGCPLRCKWCQNPESWKASPELMASKITCLELGKCVDECPEKAITIKHHKGVRVDRGKCNLCFKCVDACSSRTLKKVGTYMSVSEVLKEVERDVIFYRKSGGGVTLSGGEPLFQAAFSISLLRECKKRYLHTALDTCGYASWSSLEQALKYVDVLLYDIKHMDPQFHRKGTDKSNQLILKNLQKINSEIKIWLRVPFIPNYNDSDDNLEAIGKLGQAINAERVSILPFNRFGLSKYKQLDIRNRMSSISIPSEKSLKKAKEIIEKHDLAVVIGQ